MLVAKKKNYKQSFDCIYLFRCYINTVTYFVEYYNSGQLNIKLKLKLNRII